MALSAGDERQQGGEHGGHDGDRTFHHRARTFDWRSPNDL